MKNLMKMCKNENLCDESKIIAHAQIEIGFRILEYMGMPLSIRNLDKHIMEYFLKNDIESAVNGIIYDELDIDMPDDDSEVQITKEAINFVKDLLPIFLETKKQEKLSERESLLIKFGEVENELKMLKQKIE